MLEFSPVFLKSYQRDILTPVNIGDAMFIGSRMVKSGEEPESPGKSTGLDEKE